MALLQCNDLSLGYEGQPILQNLTFAVEQEDYLCMIGENGAGKSTLLRTLLSLQPPLSGTVTVGDGLRRTEIGYLPQQTDVQKDFPASVWEIVLSGCQNGCGMRPFYNAAEKRRARSALAQLHIEDLARRCYRELSGGQQQRVLLARALCATKKLLLLDEPVTGLDPVATRELYELIAELNREQKITVIMITHDTACVLNHARHVLHLGSPVFYGTRQEYCDSAVGRAFLQRGGAQA